MNEKKLIFFYKQIGSFFFHRNRLRKMFVNEPRALIEDTLYSCIRIRTCIGKEKIDDHDRRRRHLRYSCHRRFRRRCRCIVISQTSVLLGRLCNSIWSRFCSDGFVLPNEYNIKCRPLSRISKKRSTFILLQPPIYRPFYHYNDSTATFWCSQLDPALCNTWIFNIQTSNSNTFSGVNYVFKHVYLLVFLVEF